MDGIGARIPCPILVRFSGGDDTGQGHVPFVEDPELPALTEFFRDRLEFREPLRTRVAEMRSYFAVGPSNSSPYRDDREDFSAATRAEYFDSIPKEALQRAVVFFDPDNGMEPTWATEKHLRFDELASVMARMDGLSIAVVFQFSRRVAGFWEVMAEQLARRLDRPVAYITEPSLAFHTLVSSQAQQDAAVRVLHRIETRRTPGARARRSVGRTG